MKSPIDYFTDGYRAAEQGLPKEACPLLFDGWCMHCWMDGWSYHKSYSKILREANLSNEPLKRVDKSPFDQGTVAAMKGIGIHDCPYEKGPDWLEWRKGWLAVAREASRQNEDEIKTLGCIKIFLTYFAAIVVISIGAYFAFQ